MDIIPIMADDPTPAMNHHGGLHDATPEQLRAAAAGAGPHGGTFDGAGTLRPADPANGPGDGLILASGSTETQTIQIRDDLLQRSAVGLDRFIREEMERVGSDQVLVSFNDGIWTIGPVDP